MGIVSREQDPSTDVQRACRKLRDITILFQEHITDARSISTILHSLARLYYKDRCLIDSLLSQAVQPDTLEQFNHISLSCLIWSIGKLDYRADPDVISILVERLLQPDVLNELNSHMVGNIIWTMGTIEHYNPNLLIACSERMMIPAIWAVFNPINLAHVLWGFAKLNWKNRIYTYICVCVCVSVSARGVFVTAAWRMVLDGWIPALKAYELSL